MLQYHVSKVEKSGAQFCQHHKKQLQIGTAADQCQYWNQHKTRSAALQSSAAGFNWKWWGRRWPILNWKNRKLKSGTKTFSFQFELKFYLFKVKIAGPLDLYVKAGSDVVLRWSVGFLDRNAVMLRLHKKMDRSCKSLVIFSSHA